MQLDQDTCTPLFEQCAVRHKMSTFHSKLMSLEFHRCSTCLECFPDLSMASGGSTECTRCSHDKHIPKLYTTANNMNPGTVPPQLQVYPLFARSITCPKLYTTANNMNPGTSYRYIHCLPEVSHASLILLSTGAITSGGDACLCYHANYVNLSPTARPVWLHWSCQ